jgi:hypothetical protein
MAGRRTKRVFDVGYSMYTVMACNMARFAGVGVQLCPKHVASYVIAGRIMDACVCVGDS